MIFRQNCLSEKRKLGNIISQQPGINLDWLTFTRIMESDVLKMWLAPLLEKVKKIYLGPV